MKVTMKVNVEVWIVLWIGLTRERRLAMQKCKNAWPSHRSHSSVLHFQLVNEENIRKLSAAACTFIILNMLLVGYGLVGMVMLSKVKLKLYSLSSYLAAVSRTPSFLWVYFRRASMILIDALLVVNIVVRVLAPSSKLMKREIHLKVYFHSWMKVLVKYFHSWMKVKYTFILEWK
jgi:hypothetical protein